MIAQACVRTHICRDVQACVHTHICDGQRTGLWSWFSPPTFAEDQTQFSDLAAGALPAKLSHAAHIDGRN